MTRRTSVYLTDELSEAIAADGRTLPDLIKAGLELPSPLRLSRAEMAAVMLVLGKLGAHGGDDSQASGGGPVQESDDSKSQNGGPAHSHSDTHGIRGRRKTKEHPTAKVDTARCPHRVPAGAYCKQCEAADA